MKHLVLLVCLISVSCHVCNASRISFSAAVCSLHTTAMKQMNILQPFFFFCSPRLWSIYSHSLKMLKTPLTPSRAFPFGGDVLCFS